MKENKLVDLSMDFSVKVIKRCERIRGHYSLVNQLERFATSIGANIHEALQEIESLIQNRKYIFSVAVAHKSGGKKILAQKPPTLPGFCYFLRQFFES